MIADYCKLFDKMQPKLAPREDTPEEIEEENFHVVNPLAHDRQNQHVPNTPTGGMRRDTFINREKELNVAQKKVVGQNRALYADSPEIVGISKEIHSIHRILLEQANYLTNINTTVSKTRKSIVISANNAALAKKSSKS